MEFSKEETSLKKLEGAGMEVLHYDPEKSQFLRRRAVVARRARSMGTTAMGTGTLGTTVLGKAIGTLTHSHYHFELFDLPGGGDASTSPPSSGVMGWIGAVQSGDPGQGP